MTLDQALSKTIIGHKVRHDGMPKGAFIHYEFDGFECNGKKWFWNEEDEKADWHVIGNPIDNVLGLCQTVFDTDLAANEVEEVAFGINKEPGKWLT